MISTAKIFYHPQRRRSVNIIYVNDLFPRIKFDTDTPFESAVSPKHPASRASVNFPAAENWEGKEALHKSCQFFEVAAVPKFGLVSPDKTGFCSASIVSNFCIISYMVILNRS